MARFSIVSNVGNLFCLLVLKDGQVWNFATSRAEAVPADHTPTLSHLLPMEPYKPAGPLTAYRQAYIPLSADILSGSDLVVMSGNADGTNLSVLDSWPYASIDLPWIGRGGWSR